MVKLPILAIALCLSHLVVGWILLPSVKVRFADLLPPGRLQDQTGGTSFLRHSVNNLVLCFKCSVEILVIVVAVLELVSHVLFGGLFMLVLFSELGGGFLKLLLGPLKQVPDVPD